MTKTIVLSELNSDLDRLLLLRILSSMKAVPVKSWDGIAGSVHLFVQEYEIDGETLTIEQDNYIGLSVIGEEKLLNEILERFRSTN